MTEVLTQVGPDREIRLRDLPLKSHQRLFHERVPLPAEARARDPALGRVALRGAGRGRGGLGLPREQDRGETMSRAEVAETWFRDEYEPVVEMLREAELVAKDGTETEAYMRVSHLRYLLLRTHDWDDDVIERRAARPRGTQPATRTRWSAGCGTN